MDKESKRNWVVLTIFSLFIFIAVGTFAMRFDISSPEIQVPQRQNTATEEVSVTDIINSVGKDAIDTSGWKTYRNGGYAFEYPPDLIVSIPVSGHDLILKSDDPYIFISIDKIDRLPSDIIFDMYSGDVCFVPNDIDFIEEAVITSYDGFVPHPIIFVRVNGKDVYQLEYYGFSWPGCSSFNKKELLKFMKINKSYLGVAASFRGAQVDS